MLHKVLRNKKIILASASPRRKQIFEMLGLKSLCVPPQIEELITDQKPYLQVMHHASNKARAVALKMDEDALIVASDTIVFCDGKVLGKPETRDRAIEYLRLLSGKKHIVYSAICLAIGSFMLCDYEKSLVQFANLNDQQISYYLATKEPIDKAGAYGIQGYGSQFIEKISGCYFNVMGFPVNLFYRMVQKIPKELL
ncbi:MAG: Maf family protein [Candidatus Cloacimonetes bacterium]|nr:Maf family protein [Candidatus Cloacimonadota bacterium]